MQIIEKMIAQNDKPRAEIVIDVEILEVNRSRAKQYGLNLSEYALGVVFSPEVSPSSATTQTPRPGTAAPGRTTTTTTGQSTPPSGLASPPPFNLNTISQGVSTSDFYLAVPTAIVRFLESDTNTKLIAKPQLRGAEGSKLTAEAGRPDSGDFDQLHAARDRRRRRQPAELVYLSGRRREHRHDAAGDARRRHHPRPDAGQQLARPERLGGRRERPVLRAAHGRRRACACATASRTCSRDCCARTSASR